MHGFLEQYVLFIIVFVAVVVLFIGSNGILVQIKAGIRYKVPNHNRPALTESTSTKATFVSVFKRQTELKKSRKTDVI